MQWSGKSTSQLTNQGWKEIEAELKEAKAYIQAIPNPKKKQDAKNKDPMTHSHHKMLSKRQNTQHRTNPQVIANTWTPDKQWTHMGVEHTQDSSTTNLYLANSVAVGHGLEVREGVV